MKGLHYEYNVSLCPACDVCWYHSIVCVRPRLDQINSKFPGQTNYTLEKNTHHAKRYQDVFWISWALENKAISYLLNSRNSILFLQRFYMNNKTYAEHWTWFDLYLGEQSHISQFLRDDNTEQNKTMTHWTLSESMRTGKRRMNEKFCR